MGRHGENIRKRSDGRWEARYLRYDAESGAKRYRSVYGHTYEEAKMKRAAALRGAAVRTAKGNESSLPSEAGSGIVFRVAAREWLAAVRTLQKQSTYEKYCFVYHRFLEQTLGSVPLVQMTEKLLKERLTSCKASSQSQWKSIYSVVHGIFRYAAEHYHMTLPEIQKPAPTIHRKEAAAFTRSEQTKLLSVLYTDMDSFKLGVLLCLLTGLRLGELCALKWEDIDFANQTLSVNRTVQRLYVESGDAKTALLESAPKSVHSRRKIPLPDAMAALLQRFQNGKPYLFGKNKPLDPRTMQNHYKRILEEAGIAYKNFHTLRHTYATNCIEGGTDAKALSEMLGHSNVKTTLSFYVHPSMDLKRMYMDHLCSFYLMLHGQIMGSFG